MVSSPPVLGLLGVMALSTVLVFLKGHVASIRKGEPFVLKSGVLIQRGHPVYRRLVALSFVSYVVAFALACALIGAVIARMQGLG